MKQFGIILLLAFAIAGCQSYGDNTERTQDVKQSKRQIDSIQTETLRMQRTRDSLEAVNRAKEEELRRIQIEQDSTRKNIEESNKK